MLTIRYPKIRSTQDLIAAVQNAICLEHATILPYLTASWSISGTSAGPAAAEAILGDIWLDEMHQMLPCCNPLNALGGAPVIDQPGFVPKYPGPLPMTIGSADCKTFEVGLRRYSNALITNTFMVFEEPETPLTILVGTRNLAAEIDDHYRTIGEFYRAVSAIMAEGGEALFANPSSPQVSQGQATPVTDVKSAVDAIELIRLQGEGTPRSAVIMGDNVAHYYRFESLALGLAVKVDAKGIPYFDPKMPIVVDDVADVIQMMDDPSQVDLSQDLVALHEYCRM